MADDGMSAKGQDRTELQRQCCALLRQYPPAAYRVPAEGGAFRLHVVVAGSGRAADEVCRELLEQGQLLDTELTVTAACADAAAFAASFLRSAPELGRFVRIRVDGQPQFPDDPEEADRLASLYFVTVPQDEEQVRAYLSGEAGAPQGPPGPSSGEPDPREDAGAPQDPPAPPAEDGRYVVLAPEDGPLVFAGRGDLREKVSARRDHVSGEWTSLQRLAFNLHLIYAKEEDPDRPYRQIRREFLQEYNYISNMRAALHVRGKLACCGIDAEDADEAAARFDERIRREPELAERLSVLEHDRWLMEKLLAGYTRMKSAEQIYQGGAGTHGSGREKWHSCLVSEDRSGRGRLTEEDFAQAEREWARCGSREEFEQSGIFRFCGGDPAFPRDELDRVSLQLHIQCGVLAKERAGAVEERLFALRTHLLAAAGEVGAQAAELAENLTGAVAWMRQGRRSAVSLYDRAAEQLRALIGSPGEDAADGGGRAPERAGGRVLTGNGAPAPDLTAGIAGARALTQKTPSGGAVRAAECALRDLDELDRLLRPQKEYLADKDYKALDRLFIRRIPFALTHRPRAVLWKLLSGRETVDFYSAWQLEPEKVLFLGIAQTPAALGRIREEIRSLRRFFAGCRTKTGVSCLVFCPAGRQAPSAAAGTPDFSAPISRQAPSAAARGAAMSPAAVREEADPVLTRRGEAAALPPETERDSALRLIPVRDWTRDGLARKAAAVIPEGGADYLDVTGAEPFFSGAMEEAARCRGAAVFYVHEGQMRSLQWAEALEYPGPRKPLTVEEMFRVTGTRPEGRETAHLTGFFRSRQDLWEIAYRSWRTSLPDGAGGEKRKPNTWQPFGQAVGALYRPQEKEDHTCSLPVGAGTREEEIRLRAGREAAGELLTALRRLQGAAKTEAECPVRFLSVEELPGSVEELPGSVEELPDQEREMQECPAGVLPGEEPAGPAPESAGSPPEQELPADRSSGPAADTASAPRCALRFVLCRVPAGTGARVQEKLQSWCDEFRKGQFFDVRKSTLVWHDLRVEGLALTEANERILLAMRDESLRGGPLIEEYAAADGLCSLRFTSREALSCVQTTGKILEYTVCSAALLHGHFHDVEMGIKYRHPGQAAAAENEIDVICTKGMRSLFISCKMVSGKKDTGYLNGVLYEIALQAERFGLNARAVLAAPSYRQFDGDGRPGKEVRHALGRGVYLVGAECFRSEETLARVLDRIMDGDPDWCGFLLTQGG